MSVRTEIRGQAGIVAIDRPPVNAINHEVRRGLLDAIARLCEAGDVTHIVLCGAGDIFAAGADAGEFGKPAIAPSLPEIVEAIETCPIPVVAAIRGACLGGGLELALACRMRVADSSARLGLPEVNLGVVPGSGGTQRLPRLVGMKAALSMVPAGRIVQAEEALGIGLVDGIVKEPVETAATQGAGMRDANRPVSHMPQPHADDKAARDALALAERRMPRQSAPVEAVRLLGLAATTPFDEGLAAERAAFVALRDGPQSAALRHLFFAERGARLPAELKSVAPAPLGSTVVVGGGTMGAAIAHALARAQSRVTLIERDGDAVRQAGARLAALYDAAVARGLLDRAKADSEFATIRLQTGYGGIEGAGLAIEAVIEDMDAKRDVLTRLDSAMPNGVIATNTSYLDVNEMAGCLDDASRLIGLHFFSPAHIMKLLEIVRAEVTGRRAVATGYALASMLRKIPVMVGVCDGFVGNRILRRAREAADLLVLDGAGIEQVDAAMRDFGHAMGLYETQDMSGLDIAWANRRRHAGTRASRGRYSRVADMVCEAGWLGRKAGRGWYEYDGSGRTGVNSGIGEFIEQEARRHGISRRDFADCDVMDTLLLAQINEAANILEEGIAANSGDIDLVMVHGYGFPRFRGGLLFHADQMGVCEIYKRLRALETVDPVFWKIAPRIECMAHKGRGFLD